MRLANKVAIITGGAAGFGEAMARLFVSEGARVVVADLNGEGAQQVAASLGDSAVAIRTDVSQGADVQAMVDLALERFNGLDILVNNAGTTHRNMPMLAVDEASYDRVFAVNVKSIYHAAQAAVPVFRRQGGGVILNIASTAGLRPRPGLTWYNASKGAVITMSKSMAVELAPDKIRVNTLCPVAGETALLSEFMGEDTPEKRAAFIATIPLGRFSQPLDIARAALHLVCDESEFITGVALEVDGGRCV